MEEDTRQTPTKTRWQLITDSLTPKKASPSIAPILQSTRLAFSDKMHSVLMQANKPQRSNELTRLVTHLQPRPADHVRRRLQSSFGTTDRRETENEQLQTMFAQLKVILDSQSFVRNKDVDLKLKQQSAKISVLKRKVCQLEATVANLKKALTMVMTEQSRQHLINKRLQMMLRTQQKQLATSSQDTQRIVQKQAARITEQDIHLRGLKGSTTATGGATGTGVLHGVCALATWYIMHSPQYKIILSRIQHLLTVRRKHRKWMHLVASVHIFYILSCLISALPQYTFRWWAAIRKHSSNENDKG